MLELYNATNRTLVGFGDALGPRAPPYSYCSLNYIKCANGTSGAVTALLIKAMSLQGTLPESLSLLSQLSWLDASFNPLLSGTLATVFGALTSLRSINLDKTSISGALDPSFALWPLVVFKASDTSISGTLDPSFTAWPLTVFYVSATQLSGPLAETASAWTGLTDLNVERTGFVGSLDPLWPRLTQLATVRASNTALLSTPFARRSPRWCASTACYTPTLSRRSG